MTTPRRSILITGATGKQGQALVRLLLSRGHHIRALTRNPDSPVARKIQELGAEIVSGGMEDSSSVRRAIAGAEAVFLVTTPFESGVNSEIQQGISVADAAKRSGVKHLVYSSVPQARKETGIPAFESKAAIERHIQSLGVPHTILAPGFFMENLSGPYHLPGLHEGRFAIPLSPTRKLQMISVENVASFAAMVLEQRNQFLGQRIDLASDELTPTEIAHILSRAIGRTITHYRTPMREVLAWSKDLALVYEWLDRVGTSIDIPQLHRECTQINWQSLQTWAEAQSWGFLVRERVAVTV
jgi:uncharacterized protein YbjT (DUF2867 family)